MKKQSALIRLRHMRAETRPVLAEARQKILISGLAGLVILAVIIGIIIYSWQSPIKHARQQISNYNAYKYADWEILKVKKNEKDYLYYYAVDGKRYVFPDMQVFKSWFGDYPLDKLDFASVETMSQSPLGGNVTLRPGTLLQSPTLLNTFIVIKNGRISPVSDEKLLAEFYGSDWKRLVIVLPDYYFSQYVIVKPINSASDFPDLAAEITINQDKDLQLK
jgi:hypothetical protein